VILSNTRARVAARQKPSVPYPWYSHRTPGLRMTDFNVYNLSAMRIYNHTRPGWLESKSFGKSASWRTGTFS